MFTRWLEGMGNEVDAATIDSYNLTRNEARFVGGEEEGSVGYILWFTDSAEYAILGKVPL